MIDRIEIGHGHAHDRGGGGDNSEGCGRLPIARQSCLKRPSVARKLSSSRVRAPGDVGRQPGSNAPLVYF
jgi:hypothetical protein